MNKSDRSIIPQNKSSLQFNANLFGDDGLPLPLATAKKWGFELRHKLPDDPDNPTDRYLFSITDWGVGMGYVDDKGVIEALSRSKSKGVVFKTIPLQTLTTGGIQEIQYATDETLYQLAQGMRVTQARPQLQEIQKYLSQAGAWVDAFRRGDTDTLEQAARHMLKLEMRRKLNNRGYALEYQDERANNIEQSKIYQSEVTRVVDGQVNYAIINGFVHITITGKTKAQLIASFEHGAKSAVDTMGHECLQLANMLVSAVSAELKKFPDNYIPTEDHVKIIKALCEKYGKPLNEFARLKAEAQGCSIEELGRNVLQNRLL